MLRTEFPGIGPVTIQEVWATSTCDEDTSWARMMQGVKRAFRGTTQTGTLYPLATSCWYCGCRYQDDDGYCKRCGGPRK